MSVSQTSSSPELGGVVAALIHDPTQPLGVEHEGQRLVRRGTRRSERIEERSARLKALASASQAGRGRDERGPQGVRKAQKGRLEALQNELERGLLACACRWRVSLGAR